MWGADDVHGGTEAEAYSRILSEDALALHQTMEASTHPRLTALELDRYQSAPRTIGFANRESQIPTWEFALVLALRHSEVLFNRLRVRQDYDQLSGSVACSSSRSDLQSKIRSEFDQADYNIRLLSDTLDPVQGENPLTHIVAGEYKGGDAPLSTTIGFLIFHDLWLRFESVRDLYRGTSNEHALGTLEFAPEFREMLLRYAIGQSTVEDELVAAYREFSSFAARHPSTTAHFAQLTRATAAASPATTSGTSMIVSVLLCPGTKGPFHLIRPGRVRAEEAGVDRARPCRGLPGTWRRWPGTARSC